MVHVKHSIETKKNIYRVLAIALQMYSQNILFYKNAFTISNVFWYVFIFTWNLEKNILEYVYVRNELWSEAWDSGWMMI